MKDKKAVIFHFLMTLILLDFGMHLKKIFENPYVASKLNNFLFSITYANNTGSAFSLLQDRTQILAFFGIVVVILILIEIIKNTTFQDKTKLLSLTLFSAGALGNTIERINLGYVVDYIKLNFIDFPIFNVFDIMICTSALLYCLYVFKDFKKAKNEKN